MLLSGVGLSQLAPAGHDAIGCFLPDVASKAPNTAAKPAPNAAVSEQLVTLKPVDVIGSYAVADTDMKTTA